jgi:hypothetical protein
VLVHFDWTDGKAYWQDGFTIWGENGIELLNGRLLYKINEVEYSAPIPRLKCEAVTQYSFFGAQESRQISGAVSYPFASKEQRGYVFYRIQLPKDQLCGSNCLNYVHYNLPVQFPYSETEQQIINGKYFFDDNLLQHYTNFFLKGYRDINS